MQKLKRLILRDQKAFFTLELQMVDQAFFFILKFITVCLTLQEQD
jgi:hypothetical protein